MNYRIRSFVEYLNASDVLLSDAEVYMDNVIEWNAKQIGTNASYPRCFLEEGLQHERGQKFGQHVAQVCAEHVPHNSASCRRNMLLFDGIHFCMMESLGPRLYANWACLLQCTESSSQVLREWERGCNEMYFHLNNSVAGGLI